MKPEHKPDDRCYESELVSEDIDYCKLSAYLSVCIGKTTDQAENIHVLSISVVQEA